MRIFERYKVIGIVCSYSEAIDILYSQNTLAFTLHATLSFFFVNAQPQRLNAIRALQIPARMILVPTMCQFGNEYEIWHHAWNAIRTLPNLRTLEFFSNRGSLSDAYGPDIMDLEAVGAANRNLNFYLVVYQYPNPPRTSDIIANSAGKIVSAPRIAVVMIVRHLTSLDACSVQVALRELMMINPL